MLQSYGSWDEESVQQNVQKIVDVLLMFLRTDFVGMC